MKFLNSMTFTTSLYILPFIQLVIIFQLLLLVNQNEVLNVRLPFYSLLNHGYTSMQKKMRTSQLLPVIFCFSFLLTNPTHVLMYFFKFFICISSRVISNMCFSFVYMYSFTHSLPISNIKES